MKKVLFTCLRSESDNIKSASIINAYLMSNPKSEVNILTYEDLRESAEIISNVTNIYSINRSTLTQLSSSEIYSDATLMNTFYESISLIATLKWDEVINLSNDSVSALIISGLDAKKITGTYIGNYASAITSSQWATYLNNVMAKEEMKTISHFDVKSNLLNSPISFTNDSLKDHPDFSTKANRNFAQIRSAKDKSIKYIVGISLVDGVNKEFIDESTLTSIIDNLESHDEFKVVLLSSGEKYQREIANKLNEQFNNSLITITTDISTTSAVTRNLDVMISCTNSHLLTAEATDTFCIEICTEIGKSYIERDENIIIEAHGDFTCDIMYILSQKFGTILPVTTMDSINKAYETIKDDFGFSRTLSRGPFDFRKEIEYHLKRCYNFTLLGYPINTSLLRNLREKLSRDEIIDFVEQAKSEITFYVKTLLSALRSLKNCKDSGSNMKLFIESLDKLILSSKDNTLASAALGLLEGRIENISSTNQQENIKDIEIVLFELKSDLQVLTSIFSDLTLANTRATESTT